MDSPPGLCRGRQSFLAKSSHRLIKRKNFLLITAQTANRNAAIFRLAFADGQQNRHLGKAVMTHLVADFFVADIKRRAQTGPGQSLDHPASVVVAILGDRRHHRLNRRQPQRKAPGVVLDNHPGEAFQGTENGTMEHHRPVMLHRAILGSLERFTGVIIEHYAGRFPLWLAPVQAVVATITQDGDDYAGGVVEALTGAGLRATLDISNEKIGYKVRHHSLAKVPVLLAIGKREAENRSVSIRRLGSDQQEVLALDEAVARLSEEALPPAA